MEAEELIKEFRRLNNSLKTRQRKRRKETKSDYIKRKSRYQCNYCHHKFNKNRLNVSVEPYHYVKHGETLEELLEHYRTSRSILQELNPDVNIEKISKGDFINVPKYYKIFPNTHGICYCDKCAHDRNRLGLTHADYTKHLLAKRRNEREKVTMEFKNKIFSRDDHKCMYCEIEYGKQLDNPKLTLDHKRPIVKDGKTTEKNAIAACDYHNKDKGKLDFDVYIHRIKKRRLEKELKL